MPSHFGGLFSYADFDANAQGTLSLGEHKQGIIGIEDKSKRGDIVQQYSLEEARDQLPQLLDDARRGKTIVIIGEDGDAVELQVKPMPANPLTPRKAGSARGLVKIAPDFDATLTDFDEYME